MSSVQKSGSLLLRGAGLRGGAGRRGQTALESTVALVLLIVAGIGVWMLYKDSMIETMRAMIGFFTEGGESGS